MRFDRTFRGGTTIVLARNYRSTPAVVALAEVALGGAAGESRLHPEAVRADGAAPTVTSYADDDAEATAVADACWESRAAGMPWQSMAVLFRTNAQSSRFEAAFTRRGVPFRVGEGQRFAARPTVRLVLDELREAERNAPGRPFAQHLADVAVGRGRPEGAAAPEPDPEPAAPAEQSGSDEARQHRDALLEFGANTRKRSAAPAA